MGINGVLKKSVQHLHPSYFALVMATGIVATASQVQQYAMVGKWLFRIANIAFILLLVLFLCRLLFFFSDLAKDFADASKAPGFLTTVAGVCVLGNGYVQSVGAYSTAAALWYFGIALWVIFTYAFLPSV